MSNRLKTSFLTYRDDQVDSSLASKLCVYGYPLYALGQRFWEWREQVDSQLSQASYPYYLQSHTKTLYVAVSDERSPLPTIKAKDGTELVPEKVEYAQRHNPVWLRLILRMIGHEAGMTRGYRAMGKPMLKLHEWGGRNPGFEAVDLDAQVWQRNDKKTTEVTIKFENVALRKLKDSDKKTGKLWCYGKDKWLSRWFPSEEEHGALYQELRKAKGVRTRRPFLDLRAEKNLNSSRSYFLNRAIKQYQKQATKYGFPLKQDELSLERYPSSHRPDKGKRMRSLPLSDYKIYVVDARENLDIQLESIIGWFSELLNGEGLDIELVPAPNQTENLNDLVLELNSRYLVVLDQERGLPQDPYEITSRFADSTAVQHVIINPHEMGDVDVQQWFEVNQDGDVTGVAEDYFDYDFDLLKTHSTAVALKLVVCVKELHFKQLMRDESATIGEYLPQQSELLKDITLISDGYLLTFTNHRPLVLPLKLSEPALHDELNRQLSRHDTSIEKLIESVFASWPYSYAPIERFREKPDDFLRGLTCFIKGPDTIFLQNPGYTSPVLTPEGMDEVLGTVKNRQTKRLPRLWSIPTREDSTSFESSVDELFGDSVRESERNKFRSSVANLISTWNLMIARLPQDQAVAQNSLRPMFNKVAQTVIGGDKKMLGLWWRFLSHHLQFDVYDPRLWLKKIPGLKDMWFDPEGGYYLVGDLNNLTLKVERQPSISRWHALRGEVNPRLLMPYLDVDFIRVGQFAGRVFPHLFIRCHQEVSSKR